MRTRTTKDATGLLFDTTPFAFGPRFLTDHAGYIITDARIALVELIANAYDAGATTVKITWPDNYGEPFEIQDNGTGMTKEEFAHRWKTFSYDRRQEQGEHAELPPDTHLKTKRIAFGQTGKGRFGAFCFADNYQVETWRDGTATTITVTLTDGGNEPFHCRVDTETTKQGHGTRISTTPTKNLLSTSNVRDAIGSKFLVDPEFHIIVNGQRLALPTLDNLSTDTINIPDHGAITIHHIDATTQDRTTHLRGITWWVNKRMVGQPSWDGLDKQGAILDGRTTAAKRYSYIIEADLLKPDVTPDWTSFHVTERSNAVTKTAREHIIRSLHNLLAASRKEKKREALAEHRKALSELPLTSQRMVGQYVDEVIQKCPNLSQGDLSRAVEVLANLEKARSGYDLLQRLAACSPEDLDTWNTIMLEWSAQDAELVLSELQERLTLITRLQGLVHSSKADELHDLQPLFERGLWMFGPEYEAVDFRSNRGMAEVIKRFLKAPDTPTSRRRPDFVALPNASIGIYGAAAYDDKGESYGHRKVLIVELKNGGYEITQEEMDQGRNYAKELRTANTVQPTTEIIVYVMGATLEPGIQITSLGTNKETQIIPMRYDNLLDRAQARTFHLQQRLQETRPTPANDPEVTEVLRSPDGPLFDEPTLQETQP